MCVIDHFNNWQPCYSDGSPINIGDTIVIAETTYQVDGLRCERYDDNNGDIIISIFDGCYSDEIYQGPNFSIDKYKSIQDRLIDIRELVLSYNEEFDIWGHVRDEICNEIDELIDIVNQD
jgi:hypothetical protein